MSERLVDKIKRLWLEYRIRIVKKRIKRNVRKLDLLRNSAFMAFSWGVDEVTDYHVLAERSYPDHHVYGTEITWYDKPPKELLDIMGRNEQADAPRHILVDDYDEHRHSGLLEED